METDSESPRASRQNRSCHPVISSAHISNWNNGMVEGWNNDQAFFSNFFPNIPVFQHSNYLLVFRLS